MVNIRIWRQRTRERQRNEAVSAASRKTHANATVDRRVKKDPSPSIAQYLTNYHVAVANREAAHLVDCPLRRIECRELYHSA